MFHFLTFSFPFFLVLRLPDNSLLCIRELGYTKIEQKQVYILFVYLKNRLKETHTL